jgi:hypothetical protein
MPVNCNTFHVQPINGTFNYQQCVGKRNILVIQYLLHEIVVEFWIIVYDTDSTVVVLE